MGHDSPSHESDRPYIMKAYRTGGTPWTVIIDKQGRIRFNDFTRGYAFTSQFIAALP